MTAHISDDGFGREESVAEHTEKPRICAEKKERCGISQIMSLCGIFHDMGKNKQKFYDYIHADEWGKEKGCGERLDMLSPGQKYLYDRNHESSGKEKVFTSWSPMRWLPIICGLFDCVNEEGLNLFSKKLNEVEDYDEACHNAERDYLQQYEPEKIFEKGGRRI